MKESADASESLQSGFENYAALDLKDVKNKQTENDAVQVGSKAGTRESVVQRLQLVATEPNEVEKDFAIMQNIVFAREINKGKGVRTEKTGSLFGDYSAKDIDFKHDEIVFVHGHGNPGMFVGDFTKGKIKDETDPKGLISWEQAASVISGKLKDGAPEDQQIEIKMLSCRGAEGLESANLKGFVDAMILEMETAMVNAKVTAFNDPAVSWVGMKGITHKFADDKDIGEDAKEWKKKNAALAEIRKTEFAAFIAGNPGSNYQQRMTYIRAQNAANNVVEHIEAGIKTGALVVSPEITKTTKPGD